MFRAKFNIISAILKALLYALLTAIIVGFVFGYRYILVNGWSSEPYIPYHSIILTSKTKLENLKVGDFITYTSSNQMIFSKQSNVTHQIIAIKYDGFFEKDEEFVAVIDGKQYQMKYGYTLDKEGNLSQAPEVNFNYNTKCNIITMMRGYDGERFMVEATKEYKNIDQVVGRVVACSPMLGKTLFLIMENPLIMFGFFGCFVLLFIMKQQFSSENLRVYK